jgi:4-alpha-glucanotransferase
MQKGRRCGVLLHPTSLPGAGGIGTLGDDARHFIDLLAGMGMSWWQVLPLNPTASGNSPYSAFSAFAGNPLLIDLDSLARDGDVPLPVYKKATATARVDFGTLLPARMEAPFSRLAGLRAWKNSGISATRHPGCTTMPCSWR